MLASLSNNRVRSFTFLLFLFNLKGQTSPPLLIFHDIYGVSCPAKVPDLAEVEDKPSPLLLSYFRTLLLLDFPEVESSAFLLFKDVSAQTYSTRAERGGRV